MKSADEYLFVAVVLIVAALLVAVWARPLGLL